jgi:hypothetical protein
MSTSRYRIEVRDPDGNLVADISDRCTRRHWAVRRNRPSTIELSFDGRDLVNYFKSLSTSIEAVFSVNINEIRIYRFDTLMVAGQISYYMAFDEGDDKIRVDIQAPGWQALFAARITALTQNYELVDNWDLGAIMWDLIDQSQLQANGDFGITEGTIQTSQIGERHYVYKNIGDALVQLSEVIGGPDFEFTASKVFNVYSPKQGIARPDVVFNYPGNFLKPSTQRDGTKMFNRIIASGAGTGTERLLSTAEDLTSQASYKLRELPVNYPDVSVQTTLDDHADEDLRTNVTFLDLPVVKTTGDDPQLGSYWLGDEVTVRVTKNVEIFGHLAGVWRVEEIDVTIDQNNFEDVAVRVAR